MDDLRGLPAEIDDDLDEPERDDPPVYSDPEAVPARRNLGGRPSPARQREIATRRLLVSTMLLNGRSRRSIAAEFQISVGTVDDDVQAIRKAWRESVAQPYDQLVAHEKATLDALQAKFMADAQLGDKEAGALVIRISERRSKLLGLDRPQRYEVTTTVVQTSQLDDEITALLRQVPAPAIEASSTVRPSNGQH